MSKLESSLSDFSKAVQRLNEVLQQEKNEFIRDSAIKRFEFTFDVAWKTLKTFLEERKGVISKSPKDTFREAYNKGVMAFDNYWLDLADLRNEAVHTYREPVAEKVYAQLPEALKHFEQLLTDMQK